MAFRRDKVIAAAERYAAKGQHAKAAKNYQTVVDNDPKDTRAWLLLADCLVRAGDKKSALEKYLQVAKHFGAAKDYQKALAVYRQVLNIDGERLDVQIRCAELLREMGRRADAIAMYERTAHAYMQAGNSADGFALYRLVVQLEPEQVTKRLRLAELLSRDGIADEAIQAFQACADLLHSGDRLDEYVRVAERLLYHDANRPDEIRRLARAYLATKQPRKALLKLNLLLQSQSDDMQGLELLAETMFAMGKVDKACSVVAELAGRLSKSGASEAQLEDAVRVLDRGLQWNPGDSELAAAKRRISAIHGVGVAAGGGGGGSQSGALSFDDEDFDDDESLVTGDLSSPALDESNWGEGDDGASKGSAASGEVGAEELEEIEELDEFDEIDEIDEFDEIDELEEIEELELGDSAIALEVPDVAEVADAPSERTADSSPQRIFADAGLHEVMVLLKFGLVTQANEVLDTWVEGHGESEPSHGLRGIALMLDDDIEEGAKRTLSAAQRCLAGDANLAKYFVDQVLLRAPDNADAKMLLGSIGSGQPVAIEAQVTTDHALTEPSADDASPEDSDLLEIVDLTEESVTEDLESITDGVVAAEEADQADDAETSFDFADDDDDDDDDDMGASLTAGTLSHDPFEEGLQEEMDELSLPSDDDALEEEVAELEDERADHETSTPEEAPPEATPAEPAREDWPDITDELEELDFYLTQDLEDDARVAYLEIARQHPGHPGLEQYAHLLDDGDDEASVGETSLVDVDEEEAPTFSFEDDEDGDYLAAIFDEDAGAKKTSSSVQHKARAEVEDASASDHYDLGVAYHGMGLHSDATAAFEKAAADSAWACRAGVMIAGLMAADGDIDGAIERLESCVDSARNDNERSETYYEIAVLRDQNGDRAAAVAAMELVGDGFRDRDEKLDAWR